MKRALSLWSVAILTLCGILALASEGTTTPIIEGIRLGVHESGHTRIVLDMDSAPEFDVRPGAGSTPTIRIRVARGSFDIVAADLPASVGVVDTVMIDGREVLFSLNEEALPSRTFVIPPGASNDRHRLVVDLVPATEAEFAEAVSAVVAPAMADASDPEDGPGSDVAELLQRSDEGAATAEAQPTAPEITSVAEVASPAPMTRVPGLRPGRDDRRATPTQVAVAPPVVEDRPEPAATETEAAEADDRIVIVIDPGHGGHDPGAIGSTGLEEKRVTWAIAVNIRDELKSRGYDVVFTRDGDEYVNLRDRIDFARSRQADMFLSIHADANPVPSVRGASVYTLSEDRSVKLAQEVTTGGDFKLFDRELSTEDREVSSILYDLANTDTKNKSDRLASSLITHMTGRVRMVNNTHREAGLVVLLSPDVPAVLIELAFMSNPQDEANLGSRTWRKNTASAIADGIDSYFALGRRAGTYSIQSAGN